MSAPGFEYFTSADAGAPSLYGAAGRMIAVLDWALVTKGGWAKAYTGTNLAAYRSATGNRFYLQVDDTQTLFARLRGYRSMTAISSGANLFPSTIVAPTAYWGGGKSVTADTTPRRYWGIRTNCYVLMVVETNSPISAPSNRSIMAFGDIPSMCESDPYNTVCVGSDNPQNASLVNLLLGSPTIDWFAGSANGAHIAATPSGGVSAPGCVVSGGHMPQGQSYTAASADYGKSGRMQLAPLLIYSTESSDGAGIGIVRAVLPNIHHGVGLIPRSGIADGETVTVGSRTYKILQNNHYDPSSDGGAAYSSGFFVLEQSDTDGAL